MPATPEDIAEFTTDGVALSSPDDATADAIKAAHVDAQDGADDIIEQFFDDPDDGQALLDELQGIKALVNPPRFALEVTESLGLGSTVPITPAVPGITLVDDAAGLNVALRVRAFAQDTGTDRYSVELVK